MKALINIVIIVGFFYILGCETALSCEDQFVASINAECEHIQCVTWEELEMAIEESK